MGALNNKDGEIPIAIVWYYKDRQSNEITRIKYITPVKLEQGCACYEIHGGTYHCFAHTHILNLCGTCNFKLIYNENDLFKEFINVETNEIVKVRGVEYK